MLRVPKHVRIAAWRALLVLYVALILYLSSRPHLRPPVRFFLWDKFAHAGEYALLGFLSVQALADVPLGKGAKRTLLFLGMGILVAAVDELIQADVPGRESSILDLAADALGLLIGIWLARGAKAPEGNGEERGNSEVGGMR